jgi:hypothetical protein
MGLVASYLRELRQQARAETRDAAREAPVKQRRPRGSRRVAPPASR